MLVFFAMRKLVSGCALASQAVSIVLGVSGACITAALTARKKHFLADSMRFWGSTQAAFIFCTRSPWVRQDWLDADHAFREIRFPDNFLGADRRGFLILPMIAEKYLIRHSAVASRFILEVEAPQHD